MSLGFSPSTIFSGAELKESLTRMGSDLKQGFISSLRSAWQTLNDFARAHTASAQLQAELAIVANQIEEQEKQAEEGESIGAGNQPGFLSSSHFPRTLHRGKKCQSVVVSVDQSTRWWTAPSRRERRSLR